MGGPLVGISALALLTCLLFAPALDPGSVFFFRDVSQNHHPYRELTLSMVASGEAPLWNPYRGAGQPLLANPNALILHPTTLLFLALPFETAFKASVLLQVLLAGAGIWLLLSDLGASPRGRFLGAALFAFSGYVVSLGNLMNLLNSAAFMPLTLWLAHRALSRRFAPWGSLAAMSLAVQLAAGEPAILICTFAALLALQAFPSPQAGGAPPRRLPGRLASLVAMTLLAAALAMVAILPTTELLARSERGAGFDREEALKWSLPPVALAETILPGLFGDPTRAGIGRFWGGRLFDAGLPFILSLHLGLSGAALAFAGWWTGFAEGGRRRIEALILGGAAAVGIALALGRHLFLYPTLVNLLPPLESVRYPVKYLLLAVWAISLLAALGYDRLAAGRGDRAGGAAIGACALLLSLAVLASGAIWLAPERWLGFPAGLQGPGTRDAVRAGVAASALAGGLQAAIMVALVTARRRTPRIARAGLLAVPVAALLWGSHALNPVTEASFYTEPPLAAALLPEPDPSARLWAAPRPSGFAFRTPDAADADSLKWGFLWDRMTLRNATYFEHGYRFAYDRGNERLDVMPGAALAKRLYEGTGGSSQAPETQRLLSVAAVGTLLSYGGLEVDSLEPRGRLEGRSNVPVVTQTNVSALPRAYLVTQVEIHPDPLRALARLLDPAFDPTRVAILEEGTVVEGGAAPDVARPATISEETPTRVVVRAASDRAGYLILADTHYPGWEATVDGAPAPIIRANTMFRAVPVPAGTHEIHFRYRPGSVRSGAIASAAALLLAALLAVPRRRA